MNATSRTIVFVVVAAVSFGLAITADQFTKPAKLSGDYGKFGQDFFPEFKDPAKATALQVVSFNEELAASKEFTVVNKDGWRIKSHNNYPADGKDQLAKSAASVMALKRGAIVSHREADHERFGVLDPLDEKKDTPLKGRGTRITMLEKGEIALADFIIGNKVEGSEDKRYLRKPDEKTVYMVSAKFDISTKFTDWAETDLLKVGGIDITHLKSTRPKFNDDEELEGVDVVELSREKSADPWKLLGLDDAAEELKADEVTTMVSTLDDLKLVGVRVKPSLAGKSLLSADLRLNVPAELRSNPEFIQQAQSVLISSLGEKGFKVGKDEEGNRQLFSNEGELVASTKDGVVYRMTFGSVFSGSEEDLEIGRNEETKPDAAKSKTEDKKDEPLDDKKPKPENVTKGRYLFVRAEFDQKLLGEAPVEPVKPEPPPGVDPLDDVKSEGKDKPADTEKKDDTAKGSDPKKEDGAKPEADSKDAKKEADSKESKCGEDEAAKEKEKAKPDDAKPTPESNDDTKKDADKKPAEPTAKDKDAEKTKDEKPADDKPKDEKKPEKKEEPKIDLKAQYQEALKKFDVEKGSFVAATVAYEAKIETGKTKVKELNDRFADWYYVISNDSFDKLRLNRSELVKKKLPAEATDKKPEASDAKPENPASEPEKKPDADKPAPTDKSTDPEKPSEKDKKPEADKPAADKPKADADK